MQTPTITMEDAVQQFQQWRNSKKSKFDPIPNYLAEVVQQLLLQYSSKEITHHLHLSNRKIFSLKKENGDFLTANNKRGGRTKQKAAENVDFIPFKIAAADPIAIARDDNVPVTFKLNCTTCEIIKPNGSRLIIQTIEPKSIIEAFLCYN